MKRESLQWSRRNLIIMRNTHLQRIRRLMNGGRPLLPPDVVDEFSFVAHKLTGTIHVVKDVDAGTLACGRKLTMNLTSVDPVDFDAATVCLCIQCNSVIHRKGA